MDGNKATAHAQQIASLQAYESCGSKQVADPRIEALVTELIGRVDDKRTMLILKS